MKSAENSEIGTVQRLENGRTLITELGNKPRLLEVNADGKIVVDVPLQPETKKCAYADADGKVVWKISNDDFPDLRPFADPCGAQRLPNGNTVICSYASQEAIKVFEVTREKKIVWKYTGPHRAHEIQILTTNGKPVEGMPLK